MQEHNRSFDVESDRDREFSKVNPREEYQRLLALGVPEVSIRKLALTKARIAVSPEVITSTAKETVTIAYEGDMILLNVDEKHQALVKDGQPEREYRYGNGGPQDVKARVKAFELAYEEVKPGIYRRRSLITAIQTPRSIRFTNAYNETFYIKAGGYLVPSGESFYGIQPESMATGYALVEQS